jgi:hypothetical protein
MISNEAFVAMFLVCAAVMVVGGVLYAFTRESMGQDSTGDKSGQ